MLCIQVCQTVHLLKQMWPEGSDIRRVVCVLACAVGLKIYSNMLENANISTGAKTEQSAKVRILKISFQHNDHKHFAKRTDGFPSRYQAEERPSCFLRVYTM